MHREWKQYAVGQPSIRPNFTSPDCCPLNHVFHIAHTSDAFRIFEDRRIRSSLVWDESKLRHTRTCVTWLSPNTWVNGSFYGNIAFRFDWKELIKGKSFYWVEAVEYAPPAYRILVTRNEPSLELKRYPVRHGGGPLFYDSRKDTWYCNGQCTGEFMLDEDLWLHDCNAVGFFNHHQRTCKKDGATCSDIGHDGFEEGAKLVSRLLAQRVLEPKSPLWKLFLRSGEMSQHTEQAWKHIVLSFTKVRTRGKLRYDDPPAQAIVGAMLDRLAAGRSIKELGSLFRNRAELELTLRSLAARKFGIRLNRIPAKYELV